MKAIAVTAAALAGLVSACSVAPNAVLKSENVPEDTYLATDSRLRLAINNSIAGTSYAGQVDPTRVVCTEPSPDVATTVANAVGAGVNILGTGNASLSATQVEGLVQLGERTASIQLLRDKMYQTCLAYANGAISGTTYSLIMSRLDDTIVSLLLGETAGGAFGRKLAALGGSADAEAQASLSALPATLANLEQRIDAVAKEEQAVRDAETALANCRAREGGCPEAEENELTKKRNDAVARRDAAQRLMKDTLEASSEASSKIDQVTAGGGLSPKPDPLIAATLRDMQAEFLSGDVTRTYVSACLVELGRRADLGRLSPREVMAELGQTDPERAFVDNVALFKGLIGSDLARFCQQHFPTIIAQSIRDQHLFRMRKADLIAQVDEKKYGAQYAAAAAQANKALTEAITACNGVADADLKKACLKKAFDLPQ